MRVSQAESTWKNLGEKEKSTWYKKFNEMRLKNIDDFTALVRRMYTEHTKCHPDHATVDKNGLYLESFCSDSSGYDFDF